MSNGTLKLFGTSKRRLLALLAFVVFVLAPPNAGRAEVAKVRPPAVSMPVRPVALVIGNAEYRLVAGLRNATKDAHAIATVLRALGFEVLEGTNLDRESMSRAIGDFSEKLGPADLGLFFYAGHAKEVEGRSVLLPVDVKSGKPADLVETGIQVNAVATAMMKKGRISFILLDGGYFDGQALANTVVASSNMSIDGEDQNSPFTAALLKYIATPGVEFTWILRRVTAHMLEETKGEQILSVHSTLATDVFLAK